ncbi:hypothetical protein [Kitasatospora sp. MAA4]|uniref:hypothetical protein n=1 Tax=Kitasatospora sp. MAA4 TaxID=3035093 RepID=UPI002474D5E5|nr:hypothetical protein [Kitasatospora sp. MAA4]
MEQLLREAMAARAGQVSAHDLRPEAPPAGRIRRTRPLYTVALPLLGLAAAVSIGYLGFQGSPIADWHRTPPPAADLTARPEPTATPTPTPSQAPSSPGASPIVPASGSSSSAPPSADASPGTPYSFKGISFTVPNGWVTKDDGLQVCVIPPDGVAALAAPPLRGSDACEPYGVLISQHSTPEEVANASWPDTVDTMFRSGWGHQPYCYTWGSSPDESSPLTLQQYRFKVATLAGQPINEATWQLKCSSGSTFTARRWDFAKQQVFVSARGLRADYESGLQSILASLDVSGHPDPLAGTPAEAVGISIKGLTAGQTVHSDGSTIPFSVTYTNTSSTAFASVQPLAFTGHYDGVPNDPTETAAGTMQRQDGSAWTALPSLSVTGGTDYLTAGAAAAFPLAPGAHRTVNYRMTLDPIDGTGTLDLVGQAVVQGTGGAANPVVGSADVPLLVVH